MTGSLQIKNGIYYIIINNNTNGKRSQKWISTKLPVKGNKRKAENLLKEKIEEFEAYLNESGNAADTVLFSDYINKWLENSKKKVDPITMQGYIILAERHIIPFFVQNKLLLKDVDRQTLQSFLDDKWMHGRLDGTGGLSPRTIRIMKSILNQALNYAVKEGYIQSNPCSLLELPAEEKPETKFFTLMQLNELLTLAKDEPIYPIIKTTIIYGLRRSEVLGLKWDSVDFENNTLRIIHTVVKVSELIEKDKTKNKSSRRSFPLSPEMKEMFLAIRAEQVKNERLFGKAYAKNDYIFRWPDGRLISPDHVSRKFSKILAKNNLPHIRFHELRHSCASLLINQGKSLKEVQEWMGHSDIGVTADIYGHLETMRKREMADTMSKLISG